MVAQWTVGILIFQGVEVLDFAGPFEVFSRTRLVPGIESRRTEQGAPFLVFTVAKTSEVVRATGGLLILPTHTFIDHPPIDLLLVPGGFGTRSLLKDDVTLHWLERTASTARKVASVCTGSLLLARLGLLRGRRATTHWGAIEELRSLDASVEISTDSRVVDDCVVTSGGVASGLELAFYIVQTIYGSAVAADTARFIEYERSPRLDSHNALE
ncbi:DJ-1/PfpI family protein [Candidatus Berkelbacteria bacterium]|nr:DJ-1/PfpI family protein [Candidatus Berkelbacteria bacterium]